MKNFTLYVEWDGGGEETLLNPEWRMKGDAPDKQGRVSHRDAKVSCDFVDMRASSRLFIICDIPLFIGLTAVHSSFIVASAILKVLGQ